jgi:hypothetical protein
MIHKQSNVGIGEKYNQEALAYRGEEPLLEYLGVDILSK